MTTTNTTDDNDVFAYLLLGVFLLPALPALAGSFFAPVQVWLIGHGIITTAGVIIPIGDGAGLDVLRIVIVGAFFALMIFLTVLVLRRAKERRAARGAR